MSIPDSDSDRTVTGGEPGRNDDTSVVEDAIVVDNVKPGTPSDPGENDSDDGSTMNAEAAITGWRSRLFRLTDRFAFLAFRAVIFGLIAATAGILVAVLLRNQAEFDGSANLAAGMAQRDQQIESIRDEMSAMAGQMVLLAPQDTVASLSGSVDLAAGEIARLRMDLDSMAATLDDRIGKLQARMSEFEQSSSITANSLSEISARLDVLTSDVQHLEEMNSAMAETAPPVQPQPEEAAGGDDRLEARLQMLDERIGKLEGGRATPAAGLVDQLWLDTLEARLTAFETESEAGQQLLSRLEDTENRLAILEARQTGDDDLARSLALLAVRAAVETGAPYLLLLRHGGFTNAEIPEVVMIHAETGVEPLTDLKQGFARIARDALKADLAGNGEQGGLAGVIGTLVQVRPLEPREGDDTADVLSRAENLLNGDDLPGALQTLSPVSGPAREVLADWIEAAEARLAVLTAINTMLARPEMAP